MDLFDNLTDSAYLELVVYQFLHDIAIAVYIGGAVAMEFVLGPAQRSIPPAQAQVMGQKSADRFLWLVWGSLAVIFVTGLLRLWDLDRLGDVFDWGLSYGRTVSLLIFVWCLLVINGAIITFVLRPKLSGRMAAGVSAQRVQANQGERIKAAERVELLTRIDIGLALLAAFLGASLGWGGLL